MSLVNAPTPIDRPPRIQPALPFAEVEIPPPPEKRADGLLRVLQVALPAITIVGFIGMAAFGGGRTMWLMIPMALSVVAAIAFSLYTLRLEKQQQAAQERKYATRLVELNKEMLDSQEQQRRFYLHNYPDPASEAEIVDDAIQAAVKPPHTLRTNARLWERRTEDADFGVVRLGMGSVPSTVLYTLSDPDPLTDDPQLRAATKLMEDSRYVPDAPVILSLRPPQRSPQAEPAERDSQEQLAKEHLASAVPSLHALGIAGERSLAYQAVRSLLAHYTVFHAPTDAKLFVIADKQAEWGWAARLPHCVGGEQNSLCFFADAQGTDDTAPQLIDDEGPLVRYLEGIRRTLAQRKLQLEDNSDGAGDGHAEATLPLLLVVIDLFDAGPDTQSPLKDLESDPALALLLEAGSSLGAAVIFLVPERARVPALCQGVLEFESSAPAANRKAERTLRPYFRYAETGVNSPRLVGLADTIPELGRMEELAKKLATCSVRQGGGAALATSVPFLRFLGFNSIQELPAVVTQQWATSTNPQAADWLRARLGMLAGNKPRTVVFSAKRDGIHGMVAGATGSGKSELLISLVMALAIHYDPTVVNFVLVDYKGGNAFNDLAQLPHCVSLVTNLKDDDDGVTRMFTAIDSELERRQKLNKDTKTGDIVAYRKKGYHLRGPGGAPGRPYPYLFIVIDEFAEMIADRAEFRSQLEKITRTGRAQGVHLILAAQRPTGVTDQMRSNIQFRVCLRVETPGESRELLRRPDAAFLPNSIPGRGYLQVGNDEVELIQVAYAGDAYIDPAPVIWPKRRAGETLFAYKDAPPIYRALVRLLDKLARDQKIAPQLAPWPDPLPKLLALNDVLVSDDTTIKAITFREYLAETDLLTQGQPAEGALQLNPAVTRWLNGEGSWNEQPDWQRYALRPVVGLVDDPYGARQLPLTVDLREGHLVLIGGAGWGKTSFVRSLVVSLCATHSPNHAHIYVLDLGGRNLSMLDALAHVGAVINTDDDGYKDRVAQLFRDVLAIVDVRKTTLEQAKLDSVYDYNERHPEAALPALVIVIDNFFEFRASFDTGNEEIEDVFDQFTELMRQGKSYGVHLVVTAATVNALPPQIFNLFGTRLVLRLNDPTEYRTILSGAPGELPPIPGRGYARVDGTVLAFQTAQPFAPHAPGLADTEDLDEMAQHMQAFMQGSGRTYQEPLHIDPLPKSLPLTTFLERTWALDSNRPFVEQMQQRVAANWRASLEPAQANWLRVALGVGSGNRPRELQLEAKHDGVHGLVAGGTGSGKSELLMTMIIGLALNYDPSVLNFVLVDFKGGGAFEPFRGLPHVVDVVTNLNEAGVKRMFTAIGAEIDRRQYLNTTTGANHIVEYRREGYHRVWPDGRPGQPYPFLFIIIDEYAEMIAANPAFKDELDRITRTGRSLGINLLLAAQRPIGVTDQMRANIKYRICLRVEEIDTSREMLRRSDAAFLPNNQPGRGYLQVGNDNIELIQVAYAGETYAATPDDESRPDARQPKLYDVVVQAAQALLTGERPRAPWPEPLPNRWLLGEPLQADYWEPEDRRQVAWGDQPFAALNCFVSPWQQENGGGCWPGVTWLPIGEQPASAMRAIVGIVDDPYNARQLPLVVDFSKGHAVLFGASGWGKTTFVRTLVTSLAASHSPREFQAHILDLGDRNRMLGELPHVGSVILPNEQGYEERVQQLMRELDNVIEQRKRRFRETNVSTLFEYNARHPQAVEPALLVVIDNVGEFLETFADRAQKDESSSLLGQFVALARQSKAYGLHFVITANRLNVLPASIYSLFTERLTLRLAEADDYRAIVGGAIPDIDEIPGRGYVRVGRMPLEFQIALAAGEREREQIVGELQAIRKLGTAMAAHRDATLPEVEPFHVDALPSTSSYRQLLAKRFEFDPQENYVGRLKAAMQAAWTETAQAEQANWLHYVLGITAGNRPRTIRMSAREDGVHGLVAGGTGSGKSELLMTMIVGLAVNYSPSILNFILVDFKGGGAFKPFEQLPHCVDMVTNLNRAGVSRMFTAIGAEIERRQKLITDTDSKDIIHYRQAGKHLTVQPLPHLFVIIDEYAEMIDKNPEYRDELESITRVGRSLGINLILASQRPKGVTDQMRANIKLRICLRVEEMDTSRELLRRPDAALLPSGLAGRGYLQVGNENIELIQVGYTGEKQPDDRPLPVHWPGRPLAEATTEEDAQLFGMVVQLARELAGPAPLAKPWPAFLPERISLQSPLPQGVRSLATALCPTVTDWLNDETADLWAGIDWKNDAMRSAIGLIDNPAEARQDPLVFDLTHYHLAVMGDAGSGKSTFLRSLAISLAATHSPDELHIYGLDLGGRSLAALAGLPHVGAIIYADEEVYEERLGRLLDKLSNLADDRQKVLADASTATLYDYNARNPERPGPAVLVLIDNLAELIESHEALLDNTLIPLIRRSLAAGITFVVTHSGAANLPSKVSALFSERMTFRQSNPDRYMDIVGRGAVEFGAIAGRGYIRRNGKPLLLQVARPVGLDGDLAASGVDSAELARLAANMDRHSRERMQLQTQPDPIRILPEIVPLETMLAAAAALPSSHLTAILGQGGNLQPALVNLRKLGPHFAITGPPFSGKTTVLYNWVFSLAMRYSPARTPLLLIDPQRRFAEYGGAHRLDELPHVLAVIDEARQLAELLDNLKAECAQLAQHPERELFVLIDNFDDFIEEVGNTLDKELAWLARKYGRDGLHFVIAGGLDSSSGGVELRRRVLSANYGLGLRTAQALDAFRIGRHPAGLQEKGLNVGRGYVVKSGQTGLLQVASPYDKEGAEVRTGSEDETESRTAEMLDRWVERICTRYAGTRAAWTTPVAAPNAPGGDGAAKAAPVQDGRTTQLLEVLHRIVFTEAGDEQATVGSWDLNTVLFEVVRKEFDRVAKVSSATYGETQDEIIKEMVGTAKRELADPATAQKNGDAAH